MEKGWTTQRLLQPSRHKKSQRHESVCVCVYQQPKKGYILYTFLKASRTTGWCGIEWPTPPHTNKKWLRDFSEYKCSCCCVPSNSFCYCTADEEEEEELALNAAFHSDDSLAFKTFLRVFSFVLRKKKGKKGPTVASSSSQTFGQQRSSEGDRLGFV
jgi:hypothetical protein